MMEKVKVDTKMWDSNEEMLPKEIRRVTWNHIDGPMIVYNNGEMRWLTMSERCLIRIGLMDEEDLK